MWINVSLVYNHGIRHNKFMRATAQMPYQALIAAPFYPTENDFSVLFLDIKFFTWKKMALFPEFILKSNLTLRV